jgi:general secretion pathway protein C
MEFPLKYQGLFKNRSFCSVNLFFGPDMAKPYFITLNCIITILTAYLCVRTLYDFAVPGVYDSAPPKADVRNAEPRNEVQKPLSFYDSIARRNLFNVTEGKAKTDESINLETLEQTALQLKLWGTATGDDREAYAVIEDSRERSQNLYKKGDSLQNAVIKMILREKVVLSVNGKDEVLEMEKSKGDLMSSRASLQSSAENDEVPRAPGSQTISLDRSQIDAAMQNINDLMQQARIMPHFNNGQSDGFSLTGIRPNSLVRKMGLRNGDVITGVNGKKIESMDDAMGFYRQLGSSGNVSIQITRRGRERTIDYNIK